MKAPTIRLSFVLEWVIALAVGLATARWVGGGSELRRLLAGGKIWMNTPRTINPLLEGIAVVEGLALGWELWRRRGPVVWGLGRWTWALTALYLVIHGIETVLYRIGWTLSRFPDRLESP